MRRARRARRKRCSMPACRCSASAMASRPWWRRWAGGRRRACPRVRPRRAADHRRDAAVRGRVQDRREGSGVDEPWRPRHAAAARLPRRRHLDRRAVRGDRRRFAPALRRAVPPRGGAHAGTARRCSPISSTASPVAPAIGPWRSSATSEVARIRAQVGDGLVICGLSGGVDSAVAALLIHEAIGDQLTCIFVDHGLLRQNEAQEVVELFRGALQHPAGRGRCVARASSMR